MLRSLHKFPGLIAAALIIVLAISGAVLSVLPALETAQAPANVEQTTTVAELAGKVAAIYPGVEEIARAPSGRITAFYFDEGRPWSVIVDPATGQGVADYAPSKFQRWMTNLHRSLFLDDTGRIAAGLVATSMLILTVSGLFLTARRMGGWRRMFSRPRGPSAGRWHVEIGRLVAPGLMLSALTAIFMSLSTFGIIPDGSPTPPVYPEGMSGEIGMQVADLATLQTTSLNDLRELTFPYPGDATDTFALSTNQGEGFIDQGTGVLLVWTDHSALQRLNETIYMLHTGEGLWWFGLILGLSALGAPVMAGTGALIWWRVRRSRPRIRQNRAAGKAETVILVGSEGGTTWGFAATLHKALTDAGQSVHTAAMSRFDPALYTGADRVLILASTYGEGVAPASARGFLDRLGAVSVAPKADLAVLGFGDRQFPDFCHFAEDVVATAAAKGWAELIPMDTVDRQSPQDFARWGRTLGAALGIDLVLSHSPAQPGTHALRLISRRDFGAEVQAPTAILRFALPRANLWARLTGRALGRFQAGDLVAMVPEGADVPRLYSLASGSRDGFLEICVRKQPGGLCSNFLYGMEIGDDIPGFIRANPTFRPARGRKPVILIGAGTGIGPLAGFLRNNAKRRPMYLYFGARDATSDFLYEDELRDWQQDGRLNHLTVAFSRAKARVYVQDALRNDAARLATLVADGAQILVCGGRGMAAGVGAALAEVLLPMNLTPAMLKAEGRYVEDVY